jgi:TonB dependent receptor.
METLPQSLPLHPFTVVNLSAGIKYSYGGVALRLTFEVNNLFNKKYFMNGFYWDNFFPAAERNFMTTLKVEI